MEYAMINAQIAFVLLLWILSSLGFGGTLFYLYEKICAPAVSLQGGLKCFTQLILGMLFLCFITQVINIFLPINTFFAYFFLTLGITLCLYFCKDFFTDKILIIAAFLTFCIVALLSFLSDSVDDSIGYHIQIATWIQQSPIIFGLANIHSRLGFNGLIYNFYALSDVSLIFSHLRSFVGNEIVYFGFLVAAFYMLLKRQFTPFYALFIICCLFPFPLIILWREFQGLYSEGIGAVLGILVFVLLLYAIAYKEVKLLVPCLFISLFAVMIKIANFALVLSVFLVYCTIFKEYIFKQSIKTYLTLALLCFICILPWVIKGMMISGMIAYPANVFYIESLPWAVSNTQRQNELCWIMSWARAPGKDCMEVLSNYAWIADWFTMKPRYFVWYFEHFVYSFFACIVIASALILLHKKQKINLIQSFKLLPSQKELISIFIALLCGIIFWFVSAPDPRFGMVYIIPLLGFLFAFNFTLIWRIQPCNHHNTGKQTHIIFLSLFILSILPMFFNKFPAFTFVIIWIVCLFFPLRYERFYIPFVIITSLLCMPNLYRKYNKHIGSMKEVPKIRPIFIEEKLTNFGVKIFVHKNKEDKLAQSFNYEPLPSSPYFNENIKEEKIFGRKAYIVDKKK
ncbi:hypothetical protein LS73_008730 [Helicobacter muridarum]|nr:hypothetical protein [Helicobacter muridarum]TLD98502.1 hypothetical protein LS73_008730 [Helicobacter muridarum]